MSMVLDDGGTGENGGGAPFEDGHHEHGLPAMASLGSMGMISSALVILFLIGVS